MTGVTRGYAEIEGCRLYYEIAGKGETLVLGHAGLCDRRQWDGQWDDFSKDFRVVRYDMRGYGKSDAATDPVSRSADLYGLLKALGLKKVALLGCSMSGTSAIDFTLEHPEMVWALIPFRPFQAVSKRKERCHSLLRI